MPIDFHDTANRSTYSGREADASWREAVVTLLEPAGAAVVDVGCGGGTYTRAWSELGAATVTGVDFSEPIPDAGSTGGADAGFDPHGLGQPCANPNDTQSNCSSNLICLPLSPQNDCTSIGCEEAFDGGALPTTNPCGQTETGQQNICIPLSNTNPADSLCARGCDPNASGNECGLGDFSCWTISRRSPPRAASSSSPPVKAPRAR